nr:hypothetical protein MarFTME_348 [Marseillevirus futianmevirus]
MKSFQLVAHKKKSFWEVCAVFGQEKSRESFLYITFDSEDVKEKLEKEFARVFDGYKGVFFGELRKISVFFENRCKTLLREEMHTELEILAKTVERLEQQPRTKGQKAAIRGIRQVMLERQEQVATFIQRIQTRTEQQL